VPKRVGTKKKRVLKEALIERDGTLCTWCCREMLDAPIVPEADCDHHMTIEHVIPLAYGGSYDLFNLALACFGCNNQRGSRLEWAA